MKKYTIYQLNEICKQNNDGKIPLDVMLEILNNQENNELINIISKNYHVETSEIIGKNFLPTNGFMYLEYDEIVMHINSEQYHVYDDLKTLYLKNINSSKLILNNINKIALMLLHNYHIIYDLNLAIEDIHEVLFYVLMFNQLADFVTFESLNKYQVQAIINSIIIENITDQHINFITNNNDKLDYPLLDMMAEIQLERVGIESKLFFESLSNIENNKNYTNKNKCLTISNIKDKIKKLFGCLIVMDTKTKTEYPITKKIIENQIN